MSSSAEDSWEVTARKTDVPESESGDAAAKVIIKPHSRSGSVFQKLYLILK